MWLFEEMESRKFIKGASIGLALVFGYGVVMAVVMCVNLERILFHNPLEYWIKEFPEGSFARWQIAHIWEMIIADGLLCLLGVIAAIGFGLRWDWARKVTVGLVVLFGFALASANAAIVMEASQRPILFTGFVLLFSGCGLWICASLTKKIRSADVRAQFGQSSG